jgi:putative endonuclease
MPFYVYILYSQSIDSYYVGQSENLADRLYRHNNSGSKSTKKANDWTIVYQRPFETRALAMAEEKRIKRQKSKAYIIQLIETG